MGDKTFTFRDLMNECSIFNHSLEHFNLLKECNELDLTCTFISDQRFMIENAAFITSGDVTFTEGYLHESYDEGTVEILLEKAADKVVKIKEKIYNGCKKIFKGFLSFLRKINNHFDKLTVDGQNCVKKLKSLTITDEDIEQIKNIVNNAKNKDGAFPVRANQPYLSNIVFGNYTSADSSVSKLRNDLAAALSNEKVIADCTGMGIVLSAEEIVDIASSIVTNYKNINFAKIKGIAVTIGKSITKNSVNGLEIEVNTKQINRQSDLLQKIVDQINEVGRSVTEPIQGNIDAAAGVAKDVLDKHISNKIVNDDYDDSKDKAAYNKIDDIAEAMKELTQCYTQLSQAIGISMKLYTGLNAYRSNIIGPLKTYLDNKDKSK